MPEEADDEFMVLWGSSRAKVQHTTCPRRRMRVGVWRQAQWRRRGIQLRLRQQS